MTTTTRQTAANNATLARVKSRFNAAIYRKTLEAWNAGGEDAARAYLGTMYNDECRAERLATMFAR